MGKMDKFVSWVRPMLRGGKVPRDGTYRYLYDIWQPLAILVLAFLFPLVFYTTYTTNKSTKPDPLFICNDSGYVEKARNNYNPIWDPRLYFTINLAFGKFAFSTVKAIDAAWDVVIGRGGQVVVALIAYRTLRRSLTLNMETCALAIPTVTSFYCQQIQVFPVIQMTYNLFWSWGDSNRPVWKKPNSSGRLRLAAQIFICIYVLLFATLVSVMTGYRAQLTGYVGHDAQSQTIPIRDLVIPRLILSDGDRIGLPNSQLLAFDEIYYPSNANKSRHDTVFDAKEFIETSRDFEEPYGTLVDYHFTCLAVRQSFSSSDKTKSTYELSCGAHNCSCSVPTRGPGGEINTSNVNMTGRIVLNDSSWTLLPLLALDVIPGNFTWRPKYGWPSREPKNPSNAIDYWNGKNLEVYDTGHQALVERSYMYGNSLFNTTAVENGARCIVDDAYSWGFSSLLLLTFYCATMLFALGLILLQADIYWHSRHDYDHQAYSIYTDVLFLAEELKAAFGGDIKDSMRSPQLFRKQIERSGKGVRLEVSTLPLSRAREYNPFWPARAPEGKLVRQEGRVVFVPHSEIARDEGESTELELLQQTSAASSALSLQHEVMDQGESTELELLEQTSAVSSALSLQHEVMDTNSQAFEHRQ